jgi:hypothetical protein
MLHKRTEAVRKTSDNIYYSPTSEHWAINKGQLFCHFYLYFNLVGIIFNIPQEILDILFIFIILSLMHDNTLGFARTGFGKFPRFYKGINLIRSNIFRHGLAIS